jgi:hypothetical protein
MKQTKPYYTRIIDVQPFDIFFYYIDEQESTVKEFFEVQNKAFQKAVQRQYRLFKKYETFETDVQLRVCLN